MEIALQVFHKADRRQVFRAHMLLQRKWERISRKQAKKIFEKEKKQIMEQVKSGILTPTIEVEPWKTFFLNLYSSVGEDFGQAASHGLHGISKQADTWLKRVLDYIRIFGLLKATMITETTIQDIREIIAKGMEQGLAVERIAENIGDYYNQIEDWRSLLIARTETHTAANLGTYSFAQEAGMETHTWMAAMDEKTREWHAEANDQTVPINEPFEVAGERLMFPGDDSLGATGMNLCNCRCVEVYG